MPFVRAATLSLGLLAGVASFAPGEARAALYTFSGTIGSGLVSGGAFGLADPFDPTAPVAIDGLPFSGTLRIGNRVQSANDLPADDNAYLDFASARFTVTINGVTESVTGEPVSDPLAPDGTWPFALAVANGVNPRFGAASSGLDLLTIDIGELFSTGYFGLFLISTDDMLPGGAPGSLFSATTNGVSTDGFLAVGGLTGAPGGDSRGFDFVTQDFTVALASVPTPGAAALLGAGLFGLAGLGLRRRKQAAAA